MLTVRSDTPSKRPTWATEPAPAIRSPNETSTPPPVGPTSKRDSSDERRRVGALRPPTSQTTAARRSVVVVVPAMRRYRSRQMPNRCRQTGPGPTVARRTNTARPAHPIRRRQGHRVTPKPLTVVSCSTVTKPTDDITLRQFAKANPGRSGKGTAVDRRLPPEVVEQLIAEANRPANEQLGAAVIERWLHGLGHTSLNRNQIGYYIDKHRPPRAVADG